MQELTQDKYRRLQRLVEEAKAEADRREGTHNELVRQLKERFGCSTVAEAKKKLETLRERRDLLLAKFDKELRKYERKWNDEKQGS